MPLASAFKRRNNFIKEPVFFSISSIFFVFTSGTADVVSGVFTDVVFGPFKVSVCGPINSFKRVTVSLKSLCNVSNVSHLVSLKTFGSLI